MTKSIIFIIYHLYFEYLITELEKHDNQSSRDGDWGLFLPQLDIFWFSSWLHTIGNYSSLNPPCLCHCWNRKCLYDVIRLLPWKVTWENTQMNIMEDDLVIKKPEQKQIKNSDVV